MPKAPSPKWFDLGQNKSLQALLCFYEMILLQFNEMLSSLMMVISPLA